MRELGGNKKVIPGAGEHPAPSIVGADGCKHLMMLSSIELAAAKAKGRIFP